MLIPCDVPHTHHALYQKNYATLFNKSHPTILFAGDHAIEHLQEDFYGPHVATEARSIEHLFTIAAHSPINAFATQLGLINRYGKKYSSINYVAKLNSKTPLVTTQHSDPYSELLWSVEQAVTCAQQGNISLCGVGYTVYLGSIHEAAMLKQAAQVVYQAHSHGLAAILWMYPRGVCIKNERDGNIIAGAAGVASALGADFVKIYQPEASWNSSTEDFITKAVHAAGQTRVILSGGSYKTEHDFLHMLTQARTSGVSGFAIGRNMFQRTLADAQSLITKISRL